MKEYEVNGFANHNTQTGLVKRLGITELPLCSHKASRSVKTKDKLRLMIKTTLGCLSSALIVACFAQQICKSSTYPCPTSSLHQLVSPSFC